MARIAVFGLGYVGAVSAAALAAEGHHVIGVDTNPSKVDLIERGRSPVVEEGLTELIADGVRSGRLRATTSTAEAMEAADISLVCVGTPSRANGSLDLGQVERVCHQIGVNLPVASPRHVVVTRSTMLPGSTYRVVVPALESASGLVAFEDFGVGVNPEFLREGTSIRDFRDPAFTLVGSDDERTARVISALYAGLEADLVVAPIRVAEMVKYVSNAYHALKVTFGNEIGAICKRQGIDSHAVMEIFCRDRKLNISAAYLKPGFAFGGSCLPKDLRALTQHARRFDVDAPLLESVLTSNARQLDRAFELVRATGHKRVGVLGLSFKAGTDDLRESPLVELIERLIGKGYQVRVYDSNVSLANLQGSNREYIEREIPHIASLMDDTVGEVLAESDVVVIGNKAPEFANVLRDVDDGQVVIDLVRIGDDEPTSSNYEGIGW
jgi:GDP-mannose 6-dehydrogenase